VADVPVTVIRDDAASRGLQEISMELPLYQVDVFADRRFGGNPASVCPLGEWLPAETMQAIAAENNQSETAFFVPSGGDYELRWFTPTVEVPLCGHATLASGYIISTFIAPDREAIRFDTKSGMLEVVRRGDVFTLDLPVWPAVATEPSAELASALGAAPEELLRAGDIFLAVFATEDTVRDLSPDMAKLARLPMMGTVATAPGREVDFVSRYFAPAVGIPEDPATGGTHCALIPYWSARLGKRDLHARQVSRRRGELLGRVAGDRVMLSGRAILYLDGRIHL
jgi:PhzF family phenazine biosynthesis protein